MLKLLRTGKIQGVENGFSINEIIAVVRQQFVLGINCSIFPYRNSFRANQRLALTRKSFRIALRTDPKNRTSHGRPPARLRQTLTFVLKIREEKRPKTE